MDLVSLGEHIVCIWITFKARPSIQGHLRGTVNGHFPENNSPSLALAWRALERSTHFYLVSLNLSTWYHQAFTYHIVLIFGKANSEETTGISCHESLKYLCASLSVDMTYLGKHIASTWDTNHTKSSIHGNFPENSFDSINLVCWALGNNFHNVNYVASAIYIRHCSERQTANKNGTERKEIHWHCFSVNCQHTYKKWKRKQRMAFVSVYIKANKMVLWFLHFYPLCSALSFLLSLSVCVCV